MSSGLRPRGRRLGVDPGTARVGVAVCDPDGILATPLTTLKRDRKTNADIDELAAIAREYEVVEVVIGAPTSLSGANGRAAALADEYVELVAASVAPIEVSRFDERFTTVSASSALREAGLDSRRQRGVIDQSAATVILQAWLDQRRALAPDQPQ